MSDTELDAVRTAGAAIGEAISVFMLNPDTFEKSLAAGYPDPFAAYFAGRGGVLGDATGTTVTAVFAVFEPNLARSCWENGVAVHGASESCRIYWGQAADFARKYLADATGLDRLAALGEKVIAAADEPGLPLYAGWRAMPLADDAAARAFQVMFVLRELRAAVHFNALTISGLTPVEAHILNHGTDYAAFMGWQPPFIDAADKKALYAEVEDVTNRRMAQIFRSALTPDEADELAALAVSALAVLKASAPPPAGG
ncbi:evbL [Mycobacterium sp. CVI_P3]|uniref:EvbL n=1 Tax=Mycobacterium pinniadriaticum TaxID=2994102 RepID=A0ABT3SFU3_9MYCO|nr:evbL [Mycobacterium pinniadriaticum]MCX2931951.1 evbL [Mycobacterium pinniadriaticum]MCX2938375.1 evbL [Mycobacterium pinniadriaticum]